MSKCAKFFWFWIKLIRYIIKPLLTCHFLFYPRQQKVSCADSFEVDFCCCILVNNSAVSDSGATIHVYVSYDDGEGQSLQPNTGSAGMLSAVIQKTLDIRNSTRVYRKFTNYLDHTSTTCDHYVYKNSCQSTGIII